MDIVSRKVFKVIVLIGSGNSDLMRCFDEIQSENEGVNEAIALVTDTNKARGLVVPGEEQALYIAPSQGDWSSVFDFGYRMKERNDQLTIGWVYDEPYVRPPIDRIVNRKSGESFEALIEDMMAYLGYAPFQTPKMV